MIKPHARTPSGQPESCIVADIRLGIGLAAPETRLFRNNRGKFWRGDVVKQDGHIVTLKNARIVDCGFANGASDLIGWTSVVITPAMVGKTVAVITSQEVKTATGRPKKDQIDWIDAITAAGGIAGIVRSLADSVANIRGWKP